ncbi:putative acyl-protein thioesterase [Triangularia verruculosa]|uniref:Acyl-protein thioesterase n=1 Tax=Triangularia verruculosa TaxID=2587418 RepID=A0AAN7ARV1_9PEZI|nr:putative acyl-protein thioesterase [Triangularia verruculosa]
MAMLSTCIIPPTAPHTHTVIFLHGRGDSAKKFMSSFQEWRDSESRSLADLFPSVRWVFPQSELRAAAKFPGARMSQWFDTWNIANLHEKQELQIEGLKESVSSIKVLLDTEVNRLDGQWEKVVLAGLSQGGATVAHTLINAPKALGGIMVFSGRMPFPGRPLAETRMVLGLTGVPDDDSAVRTTPVLVQHCADDPLSRIQNGREVRDSLSNFGCEVEWQEYPTGGHWFHSPGGVEDAARWLRAHVFEEKHT